MGVVVSIGYSRGVERDPAKLKRHRTRGMLEPTAGGSEQGALRAGIFGE